MYYVIKKQPLSPSQCFIGFNVVKFAVPKESENVIFDFIIDGKKVKKWIKKEEIILLTQDKDLFLKTMDQFKKVEATQTKLVNEAKEQLDQARQTYTETINAELDEFSPDDVACIIIK